MDGALWARTQTLFQTRTGRVFLLVAQFSFAQTSQARSVVRGRACVSAASVSCCSARLAVWPSAGLLLLIHPPAAAANQRAGCGTLWSRCSRRTGCRPRAALAAESHRTGAALGRRRALVSGRWSGCWCWLRAAGLRLLLDSTNYYSRLCAPVNPSGLPWHHNRPLPHPSVFPISYLPFPSSCSPSPSALRSSRG